MIPRTHILTKTGTQIDCNPLFTPMYRLNDQWFELNPRLSSVNNPENLMPRINYNWTYTYAKGLATGGIYTEADLRSLNNHLMFPIEKAAVLNTIARDATSQNIADKTIRITTLINEEAIMDTLTKAWGKVYSFFNTVGIFSVTIFGV